MKYIEDRIEEYKKFKDSIYSESVDKRCKLTMEERKQIDFLLSTLVQYKNNVLASNLSKDFERVLDSLETRLTSRMAILFMLEQSGL